MTPDIRAELKNAIEATTGGNDLEAIAWALIALVRIHSAFVSLAVKVEEVKP